MMAYQGSKGAVVSTNPIAIAVPAAGRPPLILDLATSVASLGKILAATRAGQSIPEDWGLDSEGQPTTDPAAVKTLMPMRSEEHTSELQSLMRISYAVFCLKKKNNTSTINTENRKGIKRTDDYRTDKAKNKCKANTN